MDVYIRKAKLSDVDQVYRVLLEMIKSEDNSAKKVDQVLIKSRSKRSDFENSAKQELIREFRERNAKYLVAEIDNKVVGYIRGNIVENKNPFFKTNRTGYLNALAVLKKYGGLGIASQLNKEIETWFKEKKCSQIQLEVFENNPAIKIYEKWNYKTFNRTMVKKLK